MNAALLLSFRSLDPLHPPHPDSFLKKKKVDENKLMGLEPRSLQSGPAIAERLQLLVIS